MKVDFLSIGDITTDAFIQLQDAFVQKNKLCMNFGEKLAYKDVEIIHGVGNAANAAVAASRLGLTSAILTHIGDDLRGNLAIKLWEKEKVYTNLVVRHKDIPTNYHFVLRFGAERTILVKHENYPYTFPRMQYKPKLIYLTSITENTAHFQNDIAKYVKENEIPLAFQPGTFQIKLGYEKLKIVYENTTIFIANKQEYQQILKTKIDDEWQLIKQMHKLGPKICILTDGPRGVFASDKKYFYRLPQYPDPKPPTDRTGAGDAFSATFCAEFIKGKSIQDALLAGPINSMSVVQFTGAQKGLLSTTDIKKFLANAPNNYTIDVKDYH